MLHSIAAESLELPSGKCRCTDLIQCLITEIFIYSGRLFLLISAFISDAVRHTQIKTETVLITVLNQTYYSCRRSGKHRLILLQLRLLGHLSTHAHTHTQDNVHTHTHNPLSYTKPQAVLRKVSTPPTTISVSPLPFCSIGGACVIRANYSN